MVLKAGDYVRATGDYSVETRTLDEMKADLGLSTVSELSSDAIRGAQALAEVRIAASQWFYLVSLQSLSTGGTPAFQSITIDDAGSVLCSAGAGLTVLANATDKLGFFGAEPIVQQTVADASTSTYTLTNSPASMAALASDLVTQIQAMEADCASLAQKYNEIVAACERSGLLVSHGGMA